MGKQLTRVLQRSSMPCHEINVVSNGDRRGENTRILVTLTHPLTLGFPVHCEEIQKNRPLVRGAGLLPDSWLSRMPFRPTYGLLQ